MRRFDPAMRGLLILGIALIGNGVPVSAQAQTADCEAYDHDGNGTIDVADAAPLDAASSRMADCHTVDLSRFLDCRELDLDGDSFVGGQDLMALYAQHQLLVGCFNDSVLVRPACGSVDRDGDGRVTMDDHAWIVSLVEHSHACQGVDLGRVACSEVDYDGDLRISIRDRVILFERFAEYDACLGTEVGGTDGLWISRERLMGLETRGLAWERLFAEALSPYLRPDLSDQDDRADTRTLAKALVGVRLSRTDLIGDVRSALREVAYGSSDRDARTLSLGRALTAYVLSADIVGLAAIDPSLDRDLRRRLDTMRRATYDGRTLISTHEDRPNNWGTHAGAARVAIALYLGDDADLAAAAEVHRGFLGERSSYARFRYGALSWQADESRPVGINRRGAIRAGIDLDGAQPEEMRRGGPLGSPPVRTGYPWEALQGATVTTALLARNGHPDAWSWGDHALVRAIAYLRRLDLAHGGWWASGDDRWNLWLVNHGAGTTFPTEAGVGAGKNMGFTDWTHAR